MALEAVALAHVDSGWTYPGGDDYCGLLTEVDVTTFAQALDPQARQWIAQAQEVVARQTMPEVRTGAQCDQPHACGFHDYCAGLEPQAEMPIIWLPHFRAQPWIDRGVTNLRNLSDDVLNERQRRVRTCTAQGKVLFDRTGAAHALAGHPLPGVFIDFETIQFAVPIWAGMCRYQQTPFQ